MDSEVPELCKTSFPQTEGLSICDTDLNDYVKNSKH